MSIDSEQPEVVHIEDISLHGQPSITLLQLLSNTLVLHHTLPLIPISSLLALGASSTSFKNLIYGTPNVFRHLDLTPVNSARSEVGAIDHGGEVWRNQQLDENVTEDDFYGGPLRGIFNGLRRRNILKDVQTLILDGLAVPSDLVAEIILDPSFNVRLLSIREVQHLNEAKLRQALQYAVRSSRPEGTPKLQGLYVFGPKDPPSLTRYRSQSSQAAEKAQIGSRWNQKSGDALWEELKEVDRWYQKNGRIITRPVSDAWAGTLQACNGIISFDAVLCRGPRHQPSMNSGEDYLQPTVATYALESCAGCGTSPEGFSMLRTSPWEQFPLLAPLSLHSSTIKAAKTPSRSANGAEKKLLARCFHCIRNRYCESCQKWWCENCYSIPPTGIGLVEADLSDLSNKSYKIGVTRSCFECGLNCASCIERTQLMCRICGGGYCTIHNEGSTLTTAVRLYGSFHKASWQTHPEMTANVLQGVPKAVVAPEKCTKP